MGLQFRHLVSAECAYLPLNLENIIEIIEFVESWGTGAGGIASRGSNPAAPTTKKARPGKPAAGLIHLSALGFGPLALRLSGRSPRT